MVYQYWMYDSTFGLNIWQFLMLMNEQNISNFEKRSKFSRWILSENVFYTILWIFFYKQEIVQFKIFKSIIKYVINPKLSFIFLLNIFTVHDVYVWVELLSFWQNKRIFKTNFCSRIIGNKIYTLTRLYFHKQKRIQFINLKK